MNKKSCTTPITVKSAATYDLPESNNEGVVDHRHDVPFSPDVVQMVLSNDCLLPHDLHGVNPVYVGHVGNTYKLSDRKSPEFCLDSKGQKIG